MIEKNQLKLFVQNIIKSSDNFDKLGDIYFEEDLFFVGADECLSSLYAINKPPESATKSGETIDFGKVIIRTFKYVAILWGTYEVIKNGIPEAWENKLKSRGLTEEEAKEIVSHFFKDLKNLLEENKSINKSSKQDKLTKIVILAEKCMVNLTLEEVKFSLQKIGIEPNNINWSPNYLNYCLNVIKYLTARDKLYDWLKVLTEDGVVFATESLEKDFMLLNN